MQRNYKLAAALINFISDNSSYADFENIAKLENLACNMIRPRNYVRKPNRLQLVSQFIKEDTRNENKISIIKFVRNEWNLSLLEAKSWVEDHVPESWYRFVHAD